ncbi:glycosyltransferase [Metabacillus malikii]|uniref:GT2 family glycosyltransferase n=1 Tax=Metabacillus malikii TaxID=1504265 RepID=A0ABT9ZL46_9BACI|nr:glycosyltransferase [Metabacillus malikii]MDQ0232507.1 GT2 family glycosyltransferase [Metabacillus malikii]
MFQLPEIPPFLVNSIHKSGTHLLRQLLSGIPSLVYKGFIYSGIDTPKQHFEQIVAAGQNGYICGHIHYDKQFSQWLTDNEIKHILLIRDPRDILISFEYYLMKDLKHTPIAQYFVKKEYDREERLSKLIRGFEDEEAQFKYPSFYKSINYYLDWLKELQILVIRFEDLVISRDSQRYQLKRILNYLYNDSLPEDVIQDVLLQMENSNKPEESVTFRTGKIGNWKKEFSKRIETEFYEYAKQLIVKMEYEKPSASITLRNEVIGISKSVTTIHDNFTLECWVKPEKTHVIDEIGEVATGENKSFLFAQNRMNSVSVSIATNGVTVYEKSQNDELVATLIYEGELIGWNYVAIVYHERQPSLYINGVHVKDGVTSDNQLAPTNLLGGNLNGSHFHGEVRALRIWSKSLSDEEVKEIIDKTEFEGESELIWGNDYYNSRMYRNGRKQNIKVSVVMPNFNKFPQNQLSLTSFDHQTFNKDEYEILMVDDASTDLSIKIMEESDYSYPFKFIRSNRKLGRPNIRNLGIKHAVGDVIVFLDAEILVKADFIQQHYSAHQLHDSLAVSGSMVLRGVYSTYFQDFSPKQKNQLTQLMKQYPKEAQQRYKKYSEHEQDKIVQLLNEDDIREQKFIHLSFEKEHERYFREILFNRFGNELESFHFPWFIFCTGNVSVRRENLMKVGLFEEYPGYGWDDIEMGYRLYKSGIKFLNHLGLRTFHQEHPVASTNNDEANRNFYFFFKKYPELQLRIFALVLLHISPTNVHDIYQSYISLLNKYPTDYEEVKQSFTYMLEHVAFRKGKGLPIKNIFEGSEYDIAKIKKKLKELVIDPEINTFALNYLKMINY